MLKLYTNIFGKLYYGILAMCAMGIFSEKIFAEKIVFDFYQAPIEIEVNELQYFELQTPINESNIGIYYENLERSNYWNVLYQLLAYKNQLILNDWLYYRLINDTAEQIYKEKADKYKVLFAWYMLAKSGYSVQINYSDDKLFLSVYSLQKIYDLPIKEYKEGWLVEISHYGEPLKSPYLATTRLNLNISNFGSPFDFNLTQLPNLPKSVERVSLQFTCFGEMHKVDVDINRTMVQLMYAYPEGGLDAHTNVPMSEETEESLMTYFREMLSNYDTPTAVRCLLSFTRQSFEYRSDSSLYRIANVSFTPEETLYYQFSDCEDRSILFASLVRELLGLPVILVEFDGHAGVGVALENPVGEAIYFQGIAYTYCDPTSSDDSLPLGAFPKNVSHASYKVLLP
ncbi:MAG: hypothetical protein R2798_09505 [Chitinophagales bacterium]|nr:hypothetical protein [Bacteroidota bacterium]